MAMLFYIVRKKNGNVFCHQVNKFSSMIKEVFFTGLDNDGFFCPFTLSVGKRVSEARIFCFRKQPDRVTSFHFQVVSPFRETLWKMKEV